MEYRKERNFIVAYEDDKMQGKWNITEGCFIGKSNKPVKNIPQAFTGKYTRAAIHTVTTHGLYCNAIRLFRDHYNFDYTPARGDYFERLLSVGLLPYNIRDLDRVCKLTLNVVNYCKEELNGYYKADAVTEYLFLYEHEEWYNARMPWSKEVFKMLSSANLPFDYIKTFILRAEQEKIQFMWDDKYYMYRPICEMITNYYQMCMQMYGKVKVMPNLLSHYTQLKALYQDYKNTNYNKILAYNNDKKFLYFENDVFEARPLLTREEFHEEATNQHNCVERLYMEKVFNGNTYIVTVRHRNNPEKSFITCEVSKTGNIVQYLTFANRNVTSINALEFRAEYQQHLLQTISE